MEAKLLKKAILPAVCNRKVNIVERPDPKGLSPSVRGFELMSSCSGVTGSNELLASLYIAPSSLF